MKRIKTHKLIIVIALLVMAMPIGVSARSATLRADYATASAQLDCKFKLTKKDTATATTIITYLASKAPTKYRVAVRLEEWETKKKCTRYTYRSDAKAASISKSVKDIYQFASRHSIDNNTNTKEFAYKSFIEKE